MKVHSLRRPPQKRLKRWTFLPWIHWRGRLVILLNRYNKSFQNVFFLIFQKYKFPKEKKSTSKQTNTIILAIQNYWLPTGHPYDAYVCQNVIVTAHGFCPQQINDKCFNLLYFNNTFIVYKNNLCVKDLKIAFSWRTSATSFN